MKQWSSELPAGLQQADVQLMLTINTAAGVQRAAAGSR